MFKANNKKPGRRYWCRSGVVIINFEHVSHLFLVFLLLTLNKHMLAEIMQHVILITLLTFSIFRKTSMTSLWCFYLTPFFSVFNVNFEQVNASRVRVTSKDFKKVLLSQNLSQHQKTIKTTDYV